MKKFSKILISILMVLTINSCKKDYPKDIPDWLKIKIDQLKKETKSKGCRFDVCMYIYEYTDGSNISYWFQPGITPISFKVYDYSGKEQCSFITSPSNSCGDIQNIKNYYFKRIIWEEK